MDVFEAMETCRAIRYLKPDPVPQELIEKVIYGATRASSPSCNNSSVDRSIALCPASSAS